MLHANDERWIPEGHSLSLTVIDASEADWDTEGQAVVVVYIEARNSAQGEIVGAKIRRPDGVWAVDDGLTPSPPEWAERTASAICGGIDLTA